VAACIADAIVCCIVAGRSSAAGTGARHTRAASGPRGAWAARRPVIRRPRSPRARAAAVLALAAEVAGRAGRARRRTAAVGERARLAQRTELCANARTRERMT
jgi:hypothetical protein